MIDTTIYALLSIGAVILLSDRPYVLLFVLLTQLLIMHILQPLPMLFYIICGFGGAIAESAAIKYGKETWKYSMPADKLNIPLWLVPLWAIVGVVVLRVSKQLKNYT